MTLGDNFFKKINIEGRREEEEKAHKELLQNLKEAKSKVYSSKEEMLAAKERERQEKRKAKEEQERILAVEKEMLEKQKQKETIEKNLSWNENILDNDEALDEIYQKAKRIVGNLEIDPEEFAEIYDPIEIKNDLNTVQRYEDSFETNDTENEKKLAKMATIFEAVIAVGITHGEWYGDSIKIYPPSKFDDYINKIDGILEIENKESSEFLGLSVDATFSKVQGPDFKNKIDGVLKSIDAGEMSHVKYFKTYDGEIKKEFVIPKVILSCNKKILGDIALDFKNMDKANFREKLREHKLKEMIIDQVVNQCKLFSDYARNVGQNDIADSYNKLIDLLNFDAKENPKLKKLLEDTKVKKSDATYKIIELVSEHSQKIKKAA